MSSSAVSYSAYRSVPKFPFLDGLRAFCILPVIFHHAAGGFASFGILAQRGFLGVDMFFAISGFLIVTLLLREQDRDGEISLFNFYVRRLLRIVPLYYGIIALCIFLFCLAPHSSSAVAFFDDLPVYMSFTSNWVPVSTLLMVSWSLAAEEQFYLVWPAIQKTVRRPVPVVLVLLAVSQIIHLGFADGLLARLGYGPDSLKMLRQTTFTPILLGVLLAYVLHSERGFAWMARLVGARSAPVVLTALLLACAIFMPADLRGWPKVAIHALLALLLASVVVRQDHWLASVLSFKPIVRVGVLSYGMYLWHVLALEAVSRGVARAHLSSYLVFPSTVIATYAISELSYRKFESYFLQLKDAFQRPRAAGLEALRPSHPQPIV